MVEKNALSILIVINNRLLIAQKNAQQISTLGTGSHRNLVNGSF